MIIFTLVPQMNNIPLYVYIYFFLLYHITSSLFIHRWTLKLFPYIGYYEHAVMNMGVQVFLEDHDFISFAYPEVQFLYFMVILGLPCWLRS